MSKLIILLVSTSLLACTGKKEIGSDMLDAKLCTNSAALVPVIQQATENWNQASQNYTAVSFTKDHDDCDVLVRWGNVPPDDKESCSHVDYASGDLIEVDQNSCKDYTTNDFILTHTIGHLFMGSYHSEVSDDIMYNKIRYQHITDNDLAHLP